MDKLQMRKAILDQIERPVIPALERSVLEFGAAPGSGEIQTEALQRAIDTVSGEGSGAPLSGGVRPLGSDALLQFQRPCLCL